MEIELQDFRVRESMMPLDYGDLHRDDAEDDLK